MLRHVTILLLLLLLHHVLSYIAYTKKELNIAGVQKYSHIKPLPKLLWEFMVFAFLFVGPPIHSTNRLSEKKENQINLTLSITTSNSVPDLNESYHCL